jgi:hypothetical protein
MANKKTILVLCLMALVFCLTLVSCGEEEIAYVTIHNNSFIPWTGVVFKNNYVNIPYDISIPAYEQRTIEFDFHFIGDAFSVSALGERPLSVLSDNLPGEVPNNRSLNIRPGQGTGGSRITLYSPDFARP